jgi:signal transduction histidine kinase
VGQVLINLVNIAIKFTSTGEIEVSCTVVEKREESTRPVRHAIHISSY